MIGVLGVGQMGCAIASQLTARGRSVGVFDPDPAAPGRLPDARFFESARELAEACDVVLVVVNDDAQVVGALEGDQGALAAGRGIDVVIHSTITHDTLRSVAELAGQRGVTVIDAPVSGRMGQHSIPELAIMVGGPAEAFDRVRPVLEQYGSLVLHLGPLGTGLDAKLARNSIGYLFYLVTLEGLRLSDRAGIPRQTMWRILDHTGLEGTRGGLSGQPDPHDARPWPDEMAAHFARVAVKDLQAALDRAAELGVEMATTTASIDKMAAVFGAPQELLGRAVGARHEHG